MDRPTSKNAMGDKRYQGIVYNYNMKDKKILEFCEFKYITRKEDMRFGGTQDYWACYDYWIYPNRKKYHSKPPLDMNFFIDYVVPKLNHFELGDINRFESGWQKAFIAKLKLPRSKPVVVINKDPNEAWKEALLKLIK